MDSLENAGRFGVSPYFNAVADEVLTEIKASGGYLCSWDFANPDAVGYFVQFFDLRAADVTLGVTVPYWTIFVPEGDGAGLRGKEANALKFPLRFPVGMTYAVTTTPTGAIGPTTSITFSATIS